MGDGYPVVSKADMEWLVAELRRLAPGGAHDVLSVARIKGGLDLEICFDMKSRSRAFFTAAICQELERQMAQRTGLSPLIYLEGHPYPEAKRRLDLAAGDV